MNPRLLLPLLCAAPLLLAGCNPLYVARAGWAQAQILASREPLEQVMTDPSIDEETRGKLRFAWDGRRFAVEELGFRNAGDSYTTFARLPSDTLALVLSAAHRDRLAFRTWWFPITGRVPYRAYFSESAAIRARDRMEREGYDTYLRPTAAFSTLGWFADPVYSTLLRQDEIGVVTTIIHELAHNHLFLPGRGRFNESYANFAGHAGAIAFFCQREGGGPDTLRCERARDRWHDARLVSAYLMALEGEIRALYAREDIPPEEKARRRGEIYTGAVVRFREEVQPELRILSYGYLASEGLNNATLLSRTLYYHRLEDFHRAWEGEWNEDLQGMMAWIREAAPGEDDPFDILGPVGTPGSAESPGPVAPSATRQVTGR
jgi:predicted aminopeptidase